MPSTNSSESLLSVQHVSMRFHKYHTGIDTLKEFIVRAFRQDLKKNTFQCLNDVNFEIRQGEAVALIGKNGAGKSTLLKIISGILPPQKGQVLCKGRITPLLRLGAGFDGNANGIENIYINAAILGYLRKEIDSKLPSILEFSGLGDFIYAPIKTYSSGMLARLGFSIAVNMPSEILLIDEILAVGDLAFSKKCFKKLDELRAAGITFLIVTHSESVKRYCTRALWLDNGSIRADGDIQQVFKMYSDSMLST